MHAMKKIWIHKAASFREAEKFDTEYYLSMSAAERIETMQMLREMYYKLKGRGSYARRKGLRRSVKIIQQA